MRVIAGTARGRRLRTPSGLSIRPTSDRVKEALFSIIASRLKTFEGRSILDLCAGSGSLGIEALSRGALRAVFIDHDAKALDLIRRNLFHTGLSERGIILKGDVITLLERIANRGERFDAVLADPPYAADLALKIPETVVSLDILAPGGIMVIEHDARRFLPTLEDHGIVYTLRSYGTTSLSIYERGGSD